MKDNYYQKKYQKYIQKYHGLKGGSDAKESRKKPDLYFIRDNNCVPFKSELLPKSAQGILIEKLRNNGLRDNEVDQLSSYLRLTSGHSALHAQPADHPDRDIFSELYHRRGDNIVDNLPNHDIPVNVLSLAVKNYLYMQYSILFMGETDAFRLINSEHACQHVNRLTDKHMKDILDPSSIIRLLGIRTSVNLNNLKDQTLFAIRAFYQRSYSLLMVKLNKGPRPISRNDLHLLEVFKTMKDKARLNFSDLVEILYVINLINSRHLEGLVSEHALVLFRSMFRNIHNLQQFIANIGEIENHIVDFYR